MEELLFVPFLFALGLIPVGLLAYFVNWLGYEPSFWNIVLPLGVVCMGIQYLIEKR